MEHNAYAPPGAVVADIPDTQAATSYYVVSRLKFILLYLLTFGGYQLVWCYEHWANFKRSRKVPMWPVARALFPIFFAHSLTEEIQHTLSRANVRLAWSPKSLATTFVLLNIAMAVWNRVPDDVVGFRTAFLVLIALLAALGSTMWWIQRAANAACGDPDGAANRRFTLANWFWMLLGGAMWALILLGLALPDVPDA